VIDAPLLVTLANAGLPRRPPGAGRAVAEDPFQDAQRATGLLSSFTGRPVVAAELATLRRVAREARRIADSLVRGTAPSVGAVNRLAADCAGHAQARLTPVGKLEAAVVWDTAPVAAALARQMIDELGAIDPCRLRRCARPECVLFFYDSSRSGTQRWHNEVPCGWRERQRRRRATAGEE
jgi:predicted RNA-binding Zn ribbon-like protein